MFALFWFLMDFHLELIATRICAYFIYVILGAVRVGELSLEYDYTDDYVADDYPLAGSCSTDSEIPISHCYVVC
jgi:hypothetical protein